VRVLSLWCAVHVDFLSYVGLGFLTLLTFLRGSR